MKSLLIKLKNVIKTSTQRIVITAQLFGGNGLANHSAAGSYGFLLSVAPILIFTAFFILFAFKSSPQLIAALLGNIPFLDSVINEEWLAAEIFSVSKLGISGVISVLSIFWAGRILVLAMQRGLKVVFPGDKKRNPITDTLVTVVIEAAVIVVVLALLFGSQTALSFYKSLDDFISLPAIVNFTTSKTGKRIIYYAVLALFSFFSYILVPVNSPRKTSAFWGAFVFVLACTGTSFGLGKILDPAKYNIIYGTLGSLIFLLVNVYFFFLFFFFGAQLAFVIDYFDAFLFAEFRQVRIKKKINIIDRLFYSIEGRLKKYYHFYNKDDIIFSQGDKGNDVFFIIEGEVEGFVSSSIKSKSRSLIFKQGSLFGEISYMLSENRTLTAKAKTAVAVLALPPLLFEKILKQDSTLDRTIIEHMSRRLKYSNDQIAEMESLNNREFEYRLFDDN